MDSLAESSWVYCGCMLKVFFGLFLAVLSVCAQDWTPSKIIAINRYPPLARQAQIQGTVEIRCVLDSSGSVTAANVLSGHELLRKAAQENALQWKFKRFSEKGSDQYFDLKYVFLLEGEHHDAFQATFIFEPPDVAKIVAPPAPFNP